jgi:hypothetical protein
LKSPYLPGARSWPFRVENLICVIGGTSRPRRYAAAGGDLCDLCDLGRIYSGCGSQVAEDGISNFSASPAGLVIGNPATRIDLAEVVRDGRPQLFSGGTGDSPQTTTSARSPTSCPTNRA